MNPSELILALDQRACAAFFARSPAPLLPVAAVPAPEAAARKLSAVQGGIAQIKVFGLLSQRGDWWGSSTDEIGRELDRLMADESVGAIVLDVDSPGGVVYGTPELAAKIRAARGQGKPIVAVANSLAASAAYWIASAADQVIASPGSELGSIGVYLMHVDWSAALEQAGIKVSMIFAAPYKVEGQPFAPLTDEARAACQRDVDDYYELFLAGVAEGRRVTKAVVRKEFGQGRTMPAERAAAAGMADRIAPLDQVLAELAGTAAARSGSSRRRAERAKIERDILKLAIQAPD